MTSITRVGVLPAGVAFLDNGDGTATLSGTPQALTTGEYPITFMATGPGGTTTQSFTLKVQEVASITSVGERDVHHRLGWNVHRHQRGVPTPALTMTGTPVAGVTFVDNGNGTGTLSGTPAAGTGGTHSFTVTTINGVGTPGTQSFTLTVNDAGSFTSANNTSVHGWRRRHLLDHDEQLPGGDDDHAWRRGAADGRHTSPTTATAPPR